jgi:hypothetical protein
MSILLRPFGFIVNLADYVYPIYALWFYCEHSRLCLSYSVKFTIKPKSLSRIDIIG